MSTGWEIVQEEFACQHEAVEIRKMIIADGRVQYAKQCLQCGHNCGFVKKETIPGMQLLRGLAEFDQGLREAHQAKMTARLQELRQQDTDHWWRVYNRYLESPEWKARRTAVLERDKFLCQGCRKNRATQVHHLTYERRGREMLFDLIAVCDDCHDAIHEKAEE